LEALKGCSNKEFTKGKKGKAIPVLHQAQHLSDRGGGGGKTP
jgi:hypothetical protein